MRTRIRRALAAVAILTLLSVSLAGPASARVAPAFGGSGTGTTINTCDAIVRVPFGSWFICQPLPKGLPPKPPTALLCVWYLPNYGQQVFDECLSEFPHTGTARAFAAIADAHAHAALAPAIAVAAKPSPIVGVYLPHATGPVWISRNQVHGPYRCNKSGDCTAHMVGLVVTIRKADVAK